MDYRENLSVLFKKLHDEHGMTRYQVAIKAGVSEQTISNVLHKKRNLSTQALERLLESLGYVLQFEPANSPGET